MVIALIIVSDCAALRELALSLKKKKEAKCPEYLAGPVHQKAEKLQFVHYYGSGFYSKVHLQNAAGIISSQNVAPFNQPLAGNA